jgi:hypothetical protein
VNDAERQDLLRRLDESERARRRWKVLALAGTPLLAALLTIAGANAVASWFALRQTIQRGRLEQEKALQAEEEARMEAERAIEEREIAQRAAEEAQVRAGKALKEK